MQTRSISINDNSHSRGRKRMRRLLAAGLAAGIAALTATGALATSSRTPGANGRIVFGRFDPSLGDTVFYTVNPDGSQERQVLPDALECPRWFPDGTRIATCGDPGGGSSRIINPDDGSYRIVPNPDPNMFLPCGLAVSPDGGRLACEGFGLFDPSRNGIYTIRSSDGGGLLRVTSTPGGDDIPGGYSPDGKRLVFTRVGEGVFVVNVNGTGLREIVASSSNSEGDWSPQGNEIVFSQRATPDVHSTIWVVHVDGTGLRQVPVQPQSACGGLFTDLGTKGCFQPRWSPDGTKIVFARGTSGNNDSNIYTVNADGTGLTQVTHGGRDRSPDWGTHPLIP